MTNTAEFAAKIAGIKAAMEKEEWLQAIHLAENIGPIPDKFLPVVSNIIFYLYISRNQYQKLLALSANFDFAKSKQAVAALLLFRNRELGHLIALPAAWNLDELESAIERHARAGVLEPKELPLCLNFLSVLNRPRLLGLLHGLAVEAGGSLDNESVEIVLRCYLRHRWFEPARRFLWVNNLNNISFERFNFLIARAENDLTAIPEGNDKFLKFLRYRFGTDLPPVRSARETGHAQSDAL